MSDAADRIARSLAGEALDVAALGTPTPTAALGLQLDVLDRRLRAGERLAGWKVGFTSGTSRDAFGPGVRPFGHILASRVLASGARLPRAQIRNPGVENELCFRIGTTFGDATTTATEARAAVAAVAPAFELNEGRLRGAAPTGVRVAENLSQWGIVVGTEVPLAAAGDLAALTVSLACDGVVIASQRGSDDHIDDHFGSLATLARNLAAFGRRVEAGSLIITGAFTRAPVTAPGRFEGRFDGLGIVAVEFT